MAGLRVRATPGAVTLTGGVAKTVLAVKAPANQGLKVRRARVTFKGVTNTAVPALVEFCTCTFATNAIGTNSTDFTSSLKRVDPSRTETIQATCGHTWTTEPTVVTPFRTEVVPVYQGSFELLDTPLDPLDPVRGAGGWAIRVTAPAGVDVDPEIEFEE